MRRPSFVVLLVIALCTLATWTGTVVLAQPGAHRTPWADHDVFRSLVRGGYRPGSATRAPSGDAGATTDGEASDRSTPGAATRPSQLLDLRNWYLTLPTGGDGDPDTVHQPDLERYSSPFFQ